MNHLLRSFLSRSIKPNSPQCNATLTSVISGPNEPNWTTSLIGINDNRCFFGVLILFFPPPLHLYITLQRSKGRESWLRKRFNYMLNLIHVYKLMITVEFFSISSQTRYFPKQSLSFTSYKTFSGHKAIHNAINLCFLNRILYWSFAPN